MAGIKLHLITTQIPLFFADASQRIFHLISAEIWAAASRKTFYLHTFLKGTFAECSHQA